MHGLLGLTRRDRSAWRRYEAAAVNGPAHAAAPAALHLESHDPAGVWAVGLATRGVLESMPVAPPHGAGLPATDESVVVLRGDVYNLDDLRHEVGLPAGSPVASVIGALYARFGASFASKIDGAFALILVSPRTRRLIVASDPFGSYPLYWHSDAAGLSVASELGTVLRALDAPARLNVSAVADYVTMGFVLGDKTLAQDAFLLDPGAVLVHDLDTGETSLSRYFEPATLYQGPRLSRDAYVDALRGTFEQAVRKSLSGAHQFGLSLSGGLDSRAILSAVNGDASRLQSYTLGVQGCADQVIAEQLSRLTGTQHRFFELNERYLRDFLPNQARMVSITDGLYMSHGLTEMLALRFLADTGIEVLLRGHGGELAKTSLAWPLHTDARVFQMTDRAMFVDYLASRANYITPRVPLGTLFADGVAERAGRGSVDSLTSLLSDVALTPAELCSYVYLREHHRRFTVPSLDLFRTVLDVRLPFMDRAFLQLLLSAPAEWRDDTSVHRALTRAGNPALLRVRNSNTGAPGSAGPLVEKVFDKLNTILKRLNAPGYRHYHHFDKWMRTMLLETVERELLGPEARTSTFLRPGALRTLIDDTRAGTADHGYLLQVLLIVELWQREHGVDRVAA